MKGGRDDEHEHEGAPVADQELLRATGGEVGIFANKKVERDEDAVSDKKLMSEIFILHKFLCCLDLKRSCPSCFFGRNVATNIYLKESHHHSVKYNI